MVPKAIVYDLEILKAIRGKGEEIHEDVQYCDGWHDHANMGISVLTCYEYQTDEYRVLCGDNLHVFHELVARNDYIVGFNSARFDRKVVCAVTGCSPDPFVQKDYDILAELWVADGLDPDKFYWKTHGGYSLDDTCAVNGLAPKRLNGALAPIQWQRGNIGQVIDYCLDDTAKTKKLFDRIVATGQLNNPKFTGTVSKLRRPWLET